MYAIVISGTGTEALSNIKTDSYGNFAIFGTSTSSTVSIADTNSITTSLIQPASGT